MEKKSVSNPTVPMVYGIGTSRALNVGILFVGPESHLVTSLCTAVEQQSTYPSITVMRCRKLPLSATGRAHHLHYDLSVFMLDLTDGESLRLAEQSCAVLDVQYRCYAACLVLIHGENRSSELVDAVSFVKSLGMGVNTPVIHISSKDETSVLQLSQKILRLTAKPAGTLGYLEALQTKPLLLD